MGSHFDGRMHGRGRYLPWRTVWLAASFTCLVVGVLFLFGQPERTQAISYTPADRTALGLRAPVTNTYVVIGWNDLGMHCMNENFANLAVLPPFNTVWSQVVQPGPQPQVITAGVTIQYNVIDNTYSACDPANPARCKSNFWQYAAKLFPGSPAATTPNVGLTGATLSGTLTVLPDHFAVVGMPLTPYLDSAPAFTPANGYPYQRMHLVARNSSTGDVLAETTTVAPVSTEMRCDTCHARGQEPGGPYDSVELNILAQHDDEEGTQFATDASLRPVLCASCHSSNALGTPGVPPARSLSYAMHNHHRVGGALAGNASGVPSRSRSATEEGTNDCYLCHPGRQTQCLRDVMYAQGMSCINCHGDTANVADSQRAPTNRQPWLQEPRCETCHGAQYAANPDQLYRNSTDHGGLYCEACHGSPHAILPTNQANDNAQNIALQGHAGALSDCRVCHTGIPDDPGPHGLSGWSSIQGQITTTAGLALAVVQIAIAPGIAATTSVTGSYTVEHLPPGLYTVTPSLPGYGFQPASRTVTVPMSRSRQDFLAVPIRAWVYLPTLLR